MSICSLLGLRFSLLAYWVGIQFRMYNGILKIQLYMQKLGLCPNPLFTFFI